MGATGRRLSRDRLVITRQLEGSADVAEATRHLQGLPRALPKRDDNVLCRGRGPKFVMTRWTGNGKEVLRPRVDVTLSSAGVGIGCSAGVRVSPARINASVALVPLLPLIAAAAPLSILHAEQRLLLILMAVALGLLFAWLAWSDVPDYEEDRDHLLKVLEQILSGQDADERIPFL